MEKRLKLFPKKIDLYKSSLTHSTCNKINNYEKLEFLGDAVLNCIVSEHLFKKHKNQDQGFFSKTKSNIVARKNLNEIGKKIIPTKQIKHNLKTIPRNIYGNVLEAIIGAIYLDLGHQKSKN